MGESAPQAPSPSQRTENIGAIVSPLEYCPRPMTTFAVPRSLRHAALASALLLQAAVASGCGNDTIAPAPSASGLASDVFVAAGPWTVTMIASTLDLVLSRGDEVLLRFPMDGLQLGAVDELSDTANYDPYPILVKGPLSREPAGLRWLPVSGAELVSQSAGGFVLRMSFAEGSKATLQVEALDTGRFKVTMKPEAGGPPIAIFRLRPVVDEHEGFYGLGEYFDAVNHRGKARAMQLEVDGAIESGYNEAHVPVPLLIGTRGWGMFVESRYPGVFDVAGQSADRVDAAFGVGRASAEGLVFHLFGAERPLDVTRKYYDVTGSPRLPARWALGPWVWRNESKDQEEVEADLDAIRDNDLATSAVWIDRPYATGVNTFDFDATRFPNPQAMIDKAHGLGFRMGLWHTPYLDEAAEATKALREEAAQKGYYPKKTGLLLNKWGKPIDLTNLEAYGWWQALIGRYASMGIEGYKLDYGEDVVPGLLGARNVWEFSDGTDERTMHNLFTILYHRVYAETLPAEGGFLLCRAGKYGDQANGTIIWPGDLDATFTKHREKFTTSGESVTGVGGLPASVVAGLSLGASGFPFYGADTGGYRHSPPDKELFTRWFEQTSLSTVMQIGTRSNDVAWQPTAENGFDAEMLGWYRDYTRLHLRLFPYEWTYAKNLATDGRAITRAFGLAWPELGEHPSDQYMFGDVLLVAPVLEQDARSRAVVLPTGNWVDWWTGQTYAGGTTITVQAPLKTLPLLLQAGGIVPMLRPTVDTLAPTSEPARVDSYATTPGLLWARIAPGPASVFVVFDGAAIGQAEDGSKVTLTSSDGSEFKQGVVFEVSGFASAPSSVTNHGAALETFATETQWELAAQGWRVEPGSGGLLRIKVPAGKNEVVAVR